MPTNEWTMANDSYGSPHRSRRKTPLIIGLIVVAFAGVVALLHYTGAAEGLGPGKSYSTNVDCQANTVGTQGTVTINGTITGDAASYSVTVEVLDAATQQLMSTQTFEVRGTTTFGGTTAAQAPIGPAGIDCKITNVS
jgi:hypothetical protein